MKFMTAEKSHGVTTAHPDGYYLDDRGDTKQVIVVGPMHHTPIQIAEQFEGFEVSELKFLPSDSQALIRTVNGRGFISIILEPIK